MDMLNRDKIIPILFLIVFIKCTNNNNISHYQKAISIIDKKEYLIIYKKIQDSLDTWVLNKLPTYEAEYTYDYKVDSLLCFNADGKRMIACIHLFGNQFNSTSDNLIWFYGECINQSWYFFKGENLVLPRSLYKKDIHVPLNYRQLHQIALKEVYGGYLKRNGEINDLWFTELFEGPQYGDFNNQAASDWFLKGKRFNTRKEYYEFSHLEKVRNNWGGVNMDSIKQLPTKNNLP